MAGICGLTNGRCIIKGRGRVAEGLGTDYVIRNLAFPVLLMCKCMQ